MPTMTFSDITKFAPSHGKKRKKDKPPVLSVFGDISRYAPPEKPKSKKRKFKGSTNKNPAFGPVNATAMGNSMAGRGAGYGNSGYGVYGYGESSNPKWHISGNEKAILEDLEEEVAIWAID